VKDILRFTLVLFLVNLVAASILAATYNFTKANIQKQERIIQEEALKQVMPHTVGDRIEPIEKDGIVKYWEVFKGSGSQPQAYIFIAKKYGYSSVIETMVGIKKDGTITGVRVLSQNETPGLGARIIEIISNKTLFQVFKKEKRPEEKLAPYFTEQFTNRNIKDMELSKSGIHAITGATISSRAVLDSIKSQGMEVLNNRDE